MIVVSTRQVDQPFSATVHHATYHTPGEQQQYTWVYLQQQYTWVYLEYTHRTTTT